MRWKNVELQILNKLFNLFYLSDTLALSGAALQITVILKVGDFILFLNAAAQPK